GSENPRWQHTGGYRAKTWVSPYVCHPPQWGTEALRLPLLATQVTAGPGDVHTRNRKAYVEAEVLLDDDLHGAGTVGWPGHGRGREQHLRQGREGDHRAVLGAGSEGQARYRSADFLHAGGRYRGIPEGWRGLGSLRGGSRG